MPNDERRSGFALLRDLIEQSGLGLTLSEISHLWGSQEYEETGEEAASFAAWYNRPCLTPHDEERHQVKRALVNWYRIGSEEIPIFCQCGHTYTVNAATAPHFGAPDPLYPCSHCRKENALPYWVIFVQGSI
jgi:hypothetical protein